MAYAASGINLIKSFEVIGFDHRKPCPKAQFNLFSIDHSLSDSTPSAMTVSSKLFPC